MSTITGQPHQKRESYYLGIIKLGFGGLPEHARCDKAFVKFGAV